MTIEQAINHEKYVVKINRSRTKHKIFHNNDKDEINACLQCAEEHEQIAMWLEELQQYRAIGTVEECREARERQIGKKPYIQSDGHGETKVDCFECPNCDSFLGYVSDCKDEQYQDDYCRNCGQAILWEE